MTHPTEDVDDHNEAVGRAAMEKLKAEIAAALRARTQNTPDSQRGGA